MTRKRPMAQSSSGYAHDISPAPVIPDSSAPDAGRNSSHPTPTGLPVPVGNAISPASGSSGANVVLLYGPPGPSMTTLTLPPPKRTSYLMSKPENASIPTSSRHAPSVEIAVNPAPTVQSAVRNVARSVQFPCSSQGLPNTGMPSAGAGQEGVSSTCAVVGPVPVGHDSPPSAGLGLGFLQ